MSTNTIQAKYDELESIAKRFGQWAESNAEMSSRLRQHVTQLKHGDWIGKGSEAFFKEMGDEILPAVDRLTHALQQSQSTVSEIIIIVQQAEEEAARPFTGGASGVSQTSSIAGIVQAIAQDVSREYARGSETSAMAGIVRGIIQDVSREFAGGSVGSSLADTIQHTVGDGGQQTAGAAPVLYQAPAPGSGTPPASPTPTRRDQLQSAYNINIEKGDKEWSDEELKHLEKALSSLSREEKNALRGYHFIRWTSSAARLAVDPTYKNAQDEGGLLEADLKAKSFKISLYDKGFADPEATSDMVYGVDKGQFTIMHEMGHAMAIAETRDKYDAYAKSPTDAAEQQMTASQGRAETELEKMMKGHTRPTEYANTNKHELFAEMFAVYKANPKYLQDTQPKVFNWFQNGKFFKK